MENLDIEALRDENAMMISEIRKKDRIIDEQREQIQNMAEQIRGLAEQGHDTAHRVLREHVVSRLHVGTS